MSDSETQTSIYDDLTNLCRNIYKQCSGQECGKDVLKFLRAKSYEVLLKKSSVHVYPEPRDVNVELLGQCYAMKVEMCTVTQMERADAMAACTDTVIDDEFYQTDSVRAMLSLLLGLKNSVEYKEPFDLNPWTYGKREQLFVHFSRVSRMASYQAVYPVYPLHSFALRDDLSKEYGKRYRTRVQEALSRGKRVNPYMPMFDAVMFDRQPGTELPLLGQFLPTIQSCAVYKDKEYSESSFNDLASCCEKLDGPRGLKVPVFKASMTSISVSSRSSHAFRSKALVLRNKAIPSSRPASSVQTLCANYSGSINNDSSPFGNDINMWEIAAKYGINQHRSWQCLGNLDPPKELPFASDTNILRVFWQLQHPEKVLTNLGGNDFITDLKYLLAGIPSSTFTINQNALSFELRCDVAITNVTPNTTKHFCADFIQAGTAILRLMDIFCNYKTTYLGFIYSALEKTMQDYLFTFRHTILNLHADTELELLHKTKTLRLQVEQLSEIFNIYYQGVFPIGSRLLCWLLQETHRVVCRDVQLVLFAAIRACCIVYFRHLEQWMFIGTLFDPHGELFIKENSVPKGTRLFWVNAYVISQENTPEFLKDIVKDILTCGKNVHLLKECDPTHPLITTLPSYSPHIPCCFTSREVVGLSQLCRQYDSAANTLCGPPISVSNVLQERLLKRQRCLEIAQQKHQENIEKWRAVQLERNQICKAARNRDLEVLKQQIADKSEQKRKERMDNLQEQLQLIKMNEIEELQEKAIIKEEKQRIRDYYEELSREAELKKQRAEWKLKRIKFKDERTEMLLKDEETWSQLYKSNGNLVTKGNCQEECSEKDINVKKCEILPQTNRITENGYEEYNDNDIATMPLRKDDLKSKIYNVNQLSNGILQNVKKELSDAKSDVEEIYMNKNLLMAPAMGFRKINEQTTGSLVSTPNKPFTLRTNLVGEVNDNINQNNKITSSILTDIVNNVIENKSELTDAQKNKMKILGESNPIIGRTFEEKSYDQLTDAEKNKLKCIGNKYNNDFINDNETVVCLAKTQYSEAQLNKLKCMVEEFGIGDTSSARNTKSLTLNLNSEGLSNRNRSLNSKYDILTGQENNLYNKENKNAVELLEVHVNSVTAMSVDSTPITVTPTLRCDFGSLFIPDTANIMTLDMLQVTPETSVQDNHQISYDGFKFPKPDQIDTRLQDQERVVSIHKTNDKLSLIRVDHNKNFTDFNELKYKFLPLSDKPLQIFKDDFKCTENLTDFEIEALHISSLTKFLQQSIRIPLAVQSKLVNSAVLNYFLTTEDIMGHFKSLQHFFLMLDGEFSSSICSKLFAKMEQGASPQGVLMSSVLHGILESALAVSSSGSDPNSSRLSFTVASPPEHWQHSSPDALGCLTLLYRAPWPLSLILSQPVLDSYAHVFQYLVKVRRVAYKLEECFESLKNSLSTCGSGLLHAPQFKLIQFWRNTMTHFVRSLQTYLTGSVLHSTAWKFEKELKDVLTVDDLYSKHRSYVKKVVFLCLLNPKSQKVMDIFDSSFTAILQFNRILHSAQWNLRIQDKQYSHPRFKDLKVVFENFEEIASYCFKFCDRLAKCGYQPILAEFVDVLNINGYYSMLLQKFAESKRNSVITS